VSPGCRATWATLSHRYLYGPLVDQVLADEQLAPLPGTGRQAEDWAGPVLWPLADHLGTLRDLAAYDPQGTPGQETSLASHRTFDSFGNLVDETNPAVEFLFAFTARDRDPETGLQYHRARYYDPTPGRWVNEDPIGFAGDPTNVNRYASNSPLVYTDPYGLDGISIPPFRPDWSNDLPLPFPPILLPDKPPPPDFPGPLVPERFPATPPDPNRGPLPDRFPFPGPTSPPIIDPTKWPGFDP
jgi:RHS repeat-associated protein